jgi:hypothetical protein
MSSARNVGRHSCTAMSLICVFVQAYCKWTFRFLDFRGPERMEKDPLRGNASVPMSFPASYQAVGGQVIFSSIKPTIRFSIVGFFYWVMWLFIPFARISLGMSYNFVKCNNRNLDFTVFDQNYVCSHRLVTILTDVPDVSVWTFKVNEGPVVEYQPAISENYVTVSVLIREWLWIYRTCGLKVLQD